MNRCRHAAERVVAEVARKLKHFPFGPAGAAFAANDAEAVLVSRNRNKMI